MYQILTINDDKWRTEETDVLRIKGILEQRGFTAREADIHTAWERYSDSSAANWLLLPDDDDVVFDVVKSEFNRS